MRRKSIRNLDKATTPLFSLIPDGLNLEFVYRGSKEGSRSIA